MLTALTVLAALTPGRSTRAVVVLDVRRNHRNTHGSKNRKRKHPDLMSLRLESYSDYATSLVGLARAISEDLEQDRASWPVRRSAELVHRFQNADQERQHRMIAATPPPIGDERWDAFIGGLAEWLAVRTDISVPGWAREENRYLRYGWWITSMKSIRAWEYAGTPASFQCRGVYIHRDSLTNV